MARTVLVLGAGSSVQPFGLPTGRRLLDQLASSDEPLNVALRQRPDDARERELTAKHGEFKSACAFGGNESVDELLATRPDLREWGKFCVGVVLDQGGLFPVMDLSKPNWVRGLFGLLKRLSPAERGVDGFADTLARAIAIITFNYDRYFEMGLATYIHHSYGLDPQKTKQILARLVLYHVHGRLNQDYYFMRRKGPTYELNGPVVTPDVGMSVNQPIDSTMRLIYEEPASSGDSHSEHLEKIRALIWSAEQIYCLGFGFAEANCKKIGLHKVWDPWRGGQQRNINATRHGVSDQHLHEIARHFGDQLPAQRAPIFRYQNPRLNLVFGEIGETCDSFVDRYVRFGSNSVV